MYGDRENPTPSKCLGVFGLNFTTTERDLDREFGRFGKIEKVHVVLDGPTKRSRGFAFIYFESVEDAEKARDALNGTEISGFKIRVDFSITTAAHRPTPGVYFHHGKATRPGFRLRRGGRGGGGDRHHHHRDHGDRDRYHEDRRHYDDRRPPPSYYDRGRNFSKNYCGLPKTLNYLQVMTSTIVTTTARPATVTTDTMTIIATPGTETGTDTTRTGQWPQE